MELMASPEMMVYLEHWEQRELTVTSVPKENSGPMATWSV
jgi:hypothetical protein